jgi:anti-sigma factor RsiW
MLACRRVREHLSDEIDQALPLWQRLAVRLHMFACPNCRRVHDSLERTLAALRGLRPDEPGGETHG